MMAIPKLNDHPDVAAAKQAAEAARNHRDELRRKAADLADQQADIEQRSRGGTATADQLEILRTLPGQIEEACANRRVADKREEEARQHHELTVRRVRKEMRADRAMQREITKRRTAVVKQARRLAEVQQSAVDFLQELQDANLTQYDGPHGDTPELGLELRGFPTAASFQSALLAAIAQLENPSRK